MRLRSTLVVCAALALTVTVAPAASGTGNSQNAKRCQKGGWKSLVGADGKTFKNQGACVSYGATGGSYATGLIIPAGQTATLAHAHFCGQDSITYGYQLNFGTNVALGSISGDAFCSSDAPGTPAVVGPFPTAALLRIFLRDFGLPPGGRCDYTFYSDGLHAASTGGNPAIIGINDSAACTTPPTVPRPPSVSGGQVRANFTIEVSIQPPQAGAERQAGTPARGQRRGAAVEPVWLVSPQAGVELPPT